MGTVIVRDGRLDSVSADLSLLIVAPFFPRFRPTPLPQSDSENHPSIHLPSASTFLKDNNELEFATCKPEYVSSAFVILICSGNITFKVNFSMIPIKRHPSKSHFRISNFVSKFICLLIKEISKPFLCDTV